MSNTFILTLKLISKVILRCVSKSWWQVNFNLTIGKTRKFYIQVSKEFSVRSKWGYTYIMEQKTLCFRFCPASKRRKKFHIQIKYFGWGQNDPLHVLRGTRIKEYEIYKCYLKWINHNTEPQILFGWIFK